MSDVKVSVIVPFYNGEEYVQATMQALREQTLEEIEIICVDDESTDNTYGCLLEIQKLDDRVQVFKQKKGNAGAARNLGLQHAKGEYLLFLDSDDLYEPDLLEKLYKECEDKQADVCVCDADQYDVVRGEYVVKPQYLREKLIPEELPFSRETMGKYMLYFTNSAPWNKMVRKSFIEENEIQFQEIDRANDQYFSIMCLILAKRITVVREKLVHYKVNQEKNLTAKYSDTPLCSYEAMLYVVQALERKGLLENTDVRCAMDNKILNVVLYSLNIQKTLKPFCELYRKVKNEGFDKLGFVVREADYYFNEVEYRNLNYIMENDAEEYLLVKTQEFRGAIERKNQIIADKREEIRVLKQEKKELQKKERELNYIKGTKRYQVVWKVSGMYSKVFGKRKKEEGNE